MDTRAAVTSARRDRCSGRDRGGGAGSCSRLAGPRSAGGRREPNALEGEVQLSLEQERRHQRHELLVRRAAALRSFFCVHGPSPPSAGCRPAERSSARPGGRRRRCRSGAERAPRCPGAAVRTAVCRPVAGGCCCWALWGPPGGFASLRPPFKYRPTKTGRPVC